LTEPVWFYLRGEEYSRQIDHFVNCVSTKTLANVSPFAAALETDKVVAAMLSAAESGRTPVGAASVGALPRRTKRGLFSFLK
jgi:hypothetical protein